MAEETRLVVVDERVVSEEGEQPAAERQQVAAQ